MSHLHEALVKRVHLADIASTRWHACKSVLRCIAEHANEASADTAWPGVELMMLETGMSESVIVRTTGLLAAHGWITKTRRYGTSNLYRLNMAKLRAHQITKPAPKAVHMSEHLPALLFPGEDLTTVVAEVTAQGGQGRSRGWSLVPGRSTACQRAARRAGTELVRPVVDIAEKPQVTTSYVDSTYSPYPDPGPHPKTSNRRDRPRRSDVNHHADPTTEPVEKQNRTHRQHAGTRAAATKPAEACVSENSSTPNNPRPAAATAATGVGEALLWRLKLGWQVVEPSLIRICAPIIDARLTGGGGWTVEALTSEIENRFAAAVASCGGRGGVRKPPGLLVRIVRDLPATAYQPATTAPAVSTRLPWCGQCGSDDHRFIERVIDAGTPTERSASQHCPRCHPGSVRTEGLVHA